MPHTTTFLEHVARDLHHRHGDDLSHLTIVFPNKRASLFLNEHLSHLSDRPLWCPRHTTISELFRSHSPLSVADDILLICELWRSFTSCTGSTETLDHFYGWGSVLLSDFDDIDKSMANAQGVFSNLGDLHSYDTADYLSERQREVLRHFFRDFGDDHTSLLRKKFLQLWSRFGDIYTDYRRRLSDRGLTYEGALYREVVEDETLDFGSDTYVFVGFNALQEVERRLFRRLKQSGQALFYWDFDHYYLPEKSVATEAGEMVSRLLKEFPNEFDNASPIYDHFSEAKDITFIGAPTGSMQGRYVSQWLADAERVKAGNRSAVVLCDESLLPTVLHSIPSSVGEVNITTGFPLLHTAAASLATLLAELAFQGGAGKGRYRQRQVLAVLRHPYSEHITPEASNLCTQLTTLHRYYPTREELVVDDGTRLLFRDTTTSGEPSREYDAVREVNHWMLDVVRHVASSARVVCVDEPLTHEALFRTYTLLNRLQGLIESGDLRVDTTTYQRLLNELMRGTTVPFHGEPAVGLQVMGVLETRNLDFDHLLILSCNEGSMPKDSDNPSFIPQSIRRAFGLTTIDTRVGIYAYYFFRLLQRASDITIMYGNAADEKNTGEKSRFMLQMMVESPHVINCKALTTQQQPFMRERLPIEKTERVMEHLNALTTISPSSINRFLRCELQYFYNHVAGIKEPDATGDEIDNRLFGDIFHDASMFIYDELTGVDRDSIDEAHPFAHAGHTVSVEMLKHALKDSTVVERNLDRAFAKHLFKNDDPKAHPDFNGLQLINRRVIAHYLHQLLRIDQRLAPFTIRGLEGAIYAPLTITTTEGIREVLVGGRIDRLDEVCDADGRHIRVVDYKTGGKAIEKWLGGVNDIFDPANIPNHSDYYLQAMLYALLVSRDKEANPEGLPVRPALLFIQHAGGEEYSPLLQFGKTPILDIREHAEAFEEGLSQVVSRMLEPTVPFEPTKDKKTCQKCPYRHFCGKVHNHTSLS
ncbi:MAG: PD-(D/E)XK nuclease family protein [Prevotella sp.]|nr:PD-(D/E)XK nuclease family protein [Prevotella sp.]